MSAMLRGRGLRGEGLVTLLLQSSDLLGMSLVRASFAHW